MRKGSLVVDCRACNELSTNSLRMYEILSSLRSKYFLSLRRTAAVGVESVVCIAGAVRASLASSPRWVGGGGAKRLGRRTRVWTLV